jgi:hypothetical protein
VVFPSYQGMGIGARISDAVAEYWTRKGLNYYTNTRHPTFGRCGLRVNLPNAELCCLLHVGSYRDTSPLWKPTVNNLKMTARQNGITQSSKPSTPSKAERTKQLTHAHQVSTHRSRMRVTCCR